MIYNAMPGSIIIKTTPKASTTTTESGLTLITKQSESSIEIAEVISVGDADRVDIKVGDKVVFPNTTGLKIAENIYYLRYDDICAVLA